MSNAWPPSVLLWRDARWYNLKLCLFGMFFLAWNVGKVFSTPTLWDLRLLGSPGSRLLQNHLLSPRDLISTMLDLLFPVPHSHIECWVEDFMTLPGLWIPQYLPPKVQQRSEGSHTYQPQLACMPTPVSPLDHKEAQSWGCLRLVRLLACISTPGPQAHRSCLGRQTGACVPCTLEMWDS